MLQVNASNIGSYGDFSYKNYPEMSADFIIPQHYERYTEAEHEIWGFLLKRQLEVLKGRACTEFMDALNILRFNSDRIPEFEIINQALAKVTGWQIIGVPGLIPAEAFFAHLAARRFPVTHWMRPNDKLDYIVEPDIFHDLFGHVPLLMNPTFANYMQEYGKGGLRAIELGGDDYLKMLTTLYWFTVEFGLIKNSGGIRIYGAGILSSKGETLYSLESPLPNRFKFSLKKVMKANYSIDDFQKTYWVIDSFEQLFGETFQDFKPIYEELSQQKI